MPQVCKSSPGVPFVWESIEDPWSFTVTVVDSKWIMEDIESEIDALDDLFAGEDLTSRDGVEHEILSILVPLAMGVALGDDGDRTAEEFLQEMEAATPRRVSGG